MIRGAKEKYLMKMNRPAEHKSLHPVRLRYNENEKDLEGLNHKKIIYLNSFIKQKILSFSGLMVYSIAQHENILCYSYFGSTHFDSS